MPVAIIPWIFAGLAGAGVAAAGVGYLVDKTGEATEDTSNAAIKVVVALAVGYFVLKKAGAIK